MIRPFSFPTFVARLFSGATFMFDSSLFQLCTCNQWLQQEGGGSSSRLFAWQVAVGRQDDGTNKARVAWADVRFAHATNGGRSASTVICRTSRMHHIRVDMFGVNYKGMQGADFG